MGINTKSQTIKQALLRRVESGEWAVNERISSESVLAEEFGVCRATISGLLKELDRDGLFVSVRGKGRFVARRSRSSPTWTIGVLIHDVAALSKWWSMREIMRGIEESIALTPYHLRVQALNQNGDESVLGAWLDTKEVDGLIVTTGSDQIHTMLRESRQVPSVSVEPSSPWRESVVVGLDFLNAGYQSGHHLLELGHRRIAVLSADPSRRSTRQFHDGARLAVGCIPEPTEVDISHHVLAHDREQDGQHAIGEILALRPPVTAVVCLAEETAVGVHEGLRQAGLSVPEDVSLVSCSRRAISGLLPIEITGCRLDQRGLGGLMVETLCGLIEKRPLTMPTPVVPVELTVGNSTRPMRQMAKRM